MTRYVYIAILGCLLPGFALADTDYTCLNQCVNGGGLSGTCMQQCSYNTQKEEKGLAKGPKKNAHDQFSALYSGDTVTSKKPSLTPDAPGKNYQCITACLQNHTQYQLCQAQCTPIVAPSTSISVPAK